MSDPIGQFMAAITTAGLVPPDEVIPDGQIHRFSTSGRRSDDSGWYCLHLDFIPAGAFGCWRSGLQSTWCAKADNQMTQAEREAHRQRIADMKVKRDAAQADRRFA